MKQILYVIEREFLVGVRKKSYLLSLFIAPVLFMLPFIVGFMTNNNVKSKKKIAVIGDTKFVEESLLTQENSQYEFIVLDSRLEDLLGENKNAVPSEYLGVLHLSNDNLSSEDGLAYYTTSKIGSDSEFVKRSLYAAILQVRLSKESINVNLSRELTAPIDIETFYVANADSNVKQAGRTLAYIFGLLMYLMLLIYTNSLLRGVLEEKSSRIVEVMSMVVKPFYLMLGKIIGIALLGLLQLLMWIVVSFLFFKLAVLFGEHYLGLQLSNPSQNEFDLFANYDSLPLGKILIFTPLFFILGFLFNGSITAAIAATHGEKGDSSLSFIANILNIMSIYVAMYSVGRPDSLIAEIGQYLPFLSPVVIPAMIPLNVSIFTILTSLSILVISFLIMVYSAGKIYKISMLTTGNKLSLRDITRILLER